MDETTLREILKKHKEWLSGKGGEPADLRGANLRGSNLRGVNLRGAALSDADLRGVDLHKANLCEANLFEANLCGANLRGASLSKADLRGAYLCGAALNDVDLRGADLYVADLRGASLCGASLCGADFRGANLRGAAIDQKIVQIGPIGSRNDYTFYRVEKDIVQCGCWRGYAGGSLADFIKHVNETYPEGNKDGAKYRREYLAAIAMFQSLREDYLKDSHDKKRITEGVEA